jgi:PAS domain S-box-containing protein
MGDAPPASRRAEATGNDERYRTIFRNAHDAILVLDDLGCVECNPCALQMLGATLEDVVGHSFAHFSPELGLDGRPSVDAARQHLDAALSGEPQFFEWRFLRKDGSTFDAEVSLSSFAVGGRFLIQAMIRDVTARKRAEEALRGEKDFCQKLVQLSPTFVVAIDPRWKTALVNETMLSALGYRLGDVIGKDYFETFVPESERAGVAEVFNRIIYEREVTVSVNHVVTSDGRRVPTEWRGIPVFSGANYDFFIGVGIDITEAKRAAAQREELQAQVSRAQRMESVGRLAAGVAHDFGNLMSVVHANAQLVLRDVDEADPVHALVMDIIEAAERAAALTRQLLAFSRQDVRELHVLDVNDLLVPMERMLGGMIGEAIDLRLVLASDLGLVESDPGQLEQIVLNLALNARDAMPDGGTLTIETANVGPWVLLLVRDTGCGMDEQTKRRLFEPFFTTKPKGRGTGLGLPTVDGIVREGGGHIEVDSELGRGSVFRVYLPRLGREVVVPETARGPARRTAGAETILVVDDDDAVRGVVARVLREAGYSVLVAPNGREALRACERFTGEIHLVLTDVVMPHMGGRQLAEQLKRQRPGLRVIFLSGYTDEAVRGAGRVEPGASWIRKPFRESDVLEKVREALDGARPR